MRRPGVGRAFVLVLGMSLGACAVPTDGSPRDVPPADRDALLDTPSGAAAPGGGRVYLVTADTPGQGAVLREVSRDVASTPTALMEALLNGPSATEQDQRLRTAVPTGTGLRRAFLSGPNTLSVDVSEQILDANGDALIAAVAQIVLTVSAVDGVADVNLTVNGLDQQWPTGSGELKSGRLSPFDFPGLVETVQPAFPAVPPGGDG